jgi:chaperone BCS1
MPDCGSWEHVADKPPRPISTVVLPEGVADAILTDARAFQAAGPWHAARGLPYRRGYLLWGPPGSGKSSLAFALASELEMNLYALNLASPKLDDTGLALLLRRARGIVLIEDVDAIFDDRRRSGEDACHVTFSGFLNALDGVGSRDGQIVILSTNHLDRLDPALIRAGRVDYRLHLGNAAPGQAAALFRQFFPDSTLAPAFAELAGDSRYSMAALQQHLVVHRDDPRAAIDSFPLTLSAAA